MVQSASGGTTTWNLVNPNPILPILIGRGTESWTLHTHKIVLPNYTLPKSDGVPDRLMFINGTSGEVKVSDSFPFDTRYKGISYSPNSSEIISALGFTPYDSTNPNGYINSIPAQTWASITGKPTFATIAISGDYNDLINKPTIPTPIAQVNSDWNSNSGVSQILNKPSLSIIATTGSYLDLSDKPTIPANQVQTDWNSTTGIGAILNKPNIYFFSGTAAQYTKGDGTYGTFPVNISSFTNDSGYLTSVPVQSFSSLTGKPNTLSGYGITDAYPLTGNPSGFLTGITSSQVTSALGFIPYNGNINPNNYVTSSSLTTTLGNYATINSLTSGLAGKQNTLTLTTTGTGVATLIGSTLNIPTPVLNPGTVTSVGLSSTDFTVSGSPITTSGNITANLSTTGVTAGTYGLVTVDTKGRVTGGKRQIAYSGITDSSGNYTVVFATAFSVTPNIQAGLINGADNQNTRITNISTTGFTVTARNRVDVIGLLPTWTPVVGANIDVLITEK